MEVYVWNEGQMVATLREGRVYINPGTDRDAVAFALFKMMTEAMQPQGRAMTISFPPYVAPNQGTP